MTPASQYLRDLGEEIARTYLDAVAPRAVLLAGSAALGESDFFSDLDLIVYHDVMPAEPVFARTRERLGAERYSSLAPWSEYGFVEDFYRSGVECQLAHTTIAAWEERIEKVVARFDTSPLDQKAIQGLFEGYPMFGTEYIERWRTRAAYPEGLARAMVAEHANFWPIWSIGDRLLARDASIWMTQSLVEAAYKLFAVLAGINRRYFSPFQFKRMHRFADSLHIKPEHLADRVDRLVAGDHAAAIAELELLVAETLTLISVYMPNVELEAPRRPPGFREQPWELPGPSCS